MFPKAGQSVRCCFIRWLIRYTDISTPAAYKVVTPNWKEEVIATKKKLAQSQSLVEDPKEEVILANEVIATQKAALGRGDKQLKVARTASARSEKKWMKR